MSSNVFDENILYQAILLSVDSEIEQLEKRTENFYHTFSDDFKNKMKRMTSNRTSLNFTHAERRATRFRWKFLLVAILVLVLSVTTLFANETIRNMIPEFFSDHVEIHNTETSSEEVDFTPILLKTIPKDYEVTFEYMDSYQYSIRYENSDGFWIDYDQVSNDMDVIGITYDEKKGYNRTLTINGINVHSISDGNKNTIFFEQGDYVFTIMSNKPEEFLVELFENSDFSSDIIE